MSILFSLHGIFIVWFQRRALSSPASKTESSNLTEEVFFFAGILFKYQLIFGIFFIIIRTVKRRKGKKHGDLFASLLYILPVFKLVKSITEAKSTQMFSLP